MFFDNINLFSIIIFLLFFIVEVFLFVKNYSFYKNKKRYFLYYSNIFLILSLFILSIGIFGPKKYIASQKKVAGTKIVFALDVSTSMQVNDVSYENYLYSRLEGSKKFINDFMINFPQNKYALVVFAGDAMRILPFTNDISLFSMILAGIDKNNVSKQGTNIDEAIKKGLENFQENEAGLLVLISDGGEGEKIALTKKNSNVKILTIGVGTKNGNYIPIGQSPFGETVYKIYNNEKVVSKLGEENLIKVANFYSGEYYNLKDLEKTEKISNIIDKIGKKVFLESSENSLDLRRFLSIISFVFFVFYLILLFLNNAKKTS